MELVIEQKVLADAVKLAMRAVAKKSPHPIYATLALSAAGNTLSVSGAADTRRYDVEARAEIVKPGSLCVDASMLAGLVLRLPAGPVRLRGEGTLSLHVTAGKSKSKLLAMSADDFPPRGPLPEQRSSISTAALRDVLDVRSAMSPNDARPHLFGIALAVADGKLSANATDGHRVHLAEATDELAAPFPEMLVPAAGVAELVVLVESGPARLEFGAIGDRMWWIAEREGGTATFSHATTGDKPAVNESLLRSARNDAKKSFRVDREEAIAALGRLRMTGKGEALDACAMSFDAGDCVLSSSSERGETVERLSITGEAPKTDPIGVAIQYLAEALSHQSSDAALISFGEPLDPFVITSAGRECIVMPQRV